MIKCGQIPLLRSIKEALKMKIFFRHGKELVAYAASALLLFSGSVSIAQKPSIEEQIKEVRSEMRTSDFGNALIKADDILSKKPRDISALCLKGEIQTRLGKPAASLETFDKAIKISKDSVCAIVGKANALQRLNKEDEFSKLLGQARTMKPASALDFLARGKAFSSFLEDDKALADYDQALKLDTSLGEANFNKAMALLHKGDSAAAIGQFTAAIKFDPNYIDAITGRASAYNRKGDSQSAIADYSKAIQLNSNDAVIFYNRGVIYLKQLVYDKAVADLSAAIKLQPIFPEAYVNRGVAYTALNKWADARKDFQKAVDQEPSGDAGKNGKRGLEMLKN
jgi:tetratricopeptide (TPR) repeat protein